MSIDYAEYQQVQQFVNPALFIWIYELKSLNPYQKELMFQKHVTKHIQGLIEKSSEKPQEPGQVLKPIFGVVKNDPKD